MVNLPPYRFIAVAPALVLVAGAAAQDAGSIGGVVSDRDFEAPLSGAEVRIVETGQRATADERGNYVFGELAPGNYTLVFSGDGFQRQVRPDVVVSAGLVTTLDVFLTGDFQEMDEFVVEAIQLDSGSEGGLLQLRLESPALLDSISAELISQAGASDAAAALNLIAGATVQDGKYATIRGLPDRYVPTLLNGIRLPTSDEDKRAVQLDLFPSSVIESIQVSKSFMPDQQGDSSGGSVDIVLRSIPTENFIRFKTEYKWNSQVANRDDFLSYDGGGIGPWGNHGGSRDVPGVKNPAADPAEWVYDYDGQALGVEGVQAPAQYKWSLDLGGRHDMGDGFTVGGYLSFFYDRDAAYTDNSRLDNLVVARGLDPNDPASVQPFVGGQDNNIGRTDEYNTELFDITQGVETLQWGGLATGGIEWEGSEIRATWLYTHTTEDEAILAEDTRGRQYVYDKFGYGGEPGTPGYVPYDPYDVNAAYNAPEDAGGLNRTAAPYVRSQTLQYTERMVQSLQLDGTHEFEFEEITPALGEILEFTGLVFDWRMADSRAKQDQPDKVNFASKWLTPSYQEIEIAPPDFIFPNGFYLYNVRGTQYEGLQPGPNVNLGNIQHVYKSIEETSRQFSGDVTLEFEQWSEDAGYFKFGVFNDRVSRSYDQTTFANYRRPFPFNDPRAVWPSPDYPYFNGWTGEYVGFNYDLNGGFPFPEIPPPPIPDGNPRWEDQDWSVVAPYQNFPITTGGSLNQDAGYDGDQKLLAFYAMADVPVFEGLNIVGGGRAESTAISIVNTPKGDSVYWYPPDGDLNQLTILQPGDADVDFKQFDFLPAVAVIWNPDPTVTLRAAYSETVARQTFKELSPILQQEFVGGPIFIGNPTLQMSSLENYDLRLDWAPYDGSLFSASWFRKEVERPIEYVARGTPSFTYTTAENYPSGRLQGAEVEARIDLGTLTDPLSGLTIGGNATIINSQVEVAEQDLIRFEQAGYPGIITSRDMTGAPAYLWNLYGTLSLPETGTNLGLFFTSQGDTLLAGAGVSSKNLFIPSVYAKPVMTVNFTVTQRIVDGLQLFFKAKNLTNPSVETVYRSPDGNSEFLRSSYTSGIDLAVGISATFNF